MKLKKRYIEGAHGQIHLREAGPENPSHPPLICSHMFPQSGCGFEEFINAASDDRIVIALDFPGHGGSDAPAAPISAEEYARAIWSVVDVLGLLEEAGAVDLFGVHAGAKLTVEAAHQRPGDVRKIVLSSAAVLYPEEIENFKQGFSSLPLDEEGSRFETMWRLVVRNRPQYMTLEMCARAYSEILRGGEKFQWGQRAVFDYNIKFPDVLKKLPHPILLLNPKDELYEMTLRSLDLIQDVTLVDLPDWGHAYLEAYPEKSARIVRGWLDQDQKSAAGKLTATR